MLHTISPRAVALAAVVIASRVTACGGAPPAPSRSVDPAAASASSGADVETGELIWLSARTVEENDFATAVELALVREDGTVPWRSTLELQPKVPGGLVVAGPRSGVLAYGRLEGNEVQFTAVRATDGAEAPIGRADGTVVGAVLDPSGTSLYVAVSGEKLRILRLPVGGGEGDQVVELPNDGRLVLTWNRLHITPDGVRLVIEDCAVDCTWTTVRLSDGDVAGIHAAAAGAMVDVSNDTLLAASNDCTTGPCAFLLIDLDSGEATPWDPHAHEARLGIGEDGRTLLLHDEQGTGGEVGPVTITDPLTSEERIVRVTDRSGIGLGLAREGQDVWVPAGWALLAPPGSNVGEMDGPTLMRLADGVLRHLPPAELP